MLNTIIFCCLSFVTTCIGFWIFIKCFPEKRWKNKWCDLLLLVIFLFLAAVKAWDAQHAYISSLQILFYNFAIACLLKVFYKCEFRAALLWEYLYGFTIVIVKMPVLTARGVLENTSVRVNIAERSIWENIWCLAIILILTAVYIKWSKQITDWLKRILVRSKGILFVFVFMEFSLENFIIDLGLQIFQLKDFLLNIFVVFSVFAVFLIFVIYFLYRDGKMEQENLNAQRERLLEEQRITQGYFEQDARRLHDMKHILLYLQKCIKNNEIEKAEKCLAQYVQEVSENQKKVWTGISGVDFLIEYEYQKMKENRITFSMQIDLCELPIEEQDFMIILGNLLDNAVEASEKCSIDNRKIFLNMKTINNMFMLDLRNSCQMEPIEKKGHLITTKNNQIWHGWGMKNVEQIVHQYGGDFQHRYTEGEFSVSITFYGGKF